MRRHAPSVFSFVDDPRPAYLLRLERLAGFLERTPPGTFLEVGPGRGDLACWLAARGFQGVLVEPSPEAGDTLRRRFAQQQRITIHPNTLETLPEMPPVDLAIACEVLEHLPDDAGLLAQLARRVKPHGVLAGSVPAFGRLMGDSDRLVGHLRRYERADLIALLENTGWRPLEVACTGFPLGRLARPFGEWLARRRLRSAGADRSERTYRSGVQRLFPAALRADLLAPLLAPAFSLQRAFEQRDLGTGFFFAAVRRG